MKFLKKRFSKDGIVPSWDTAETQCSSGSISMRTSSGGEGWGVIKNKTTDEAFAIKKRAKEHRDVNGESGLAWNRTVSAVSAPVTTVSRLCDGLAIRTSRTTRRARSGGGTRKLTVVTTTATESAAPVVHEDLECAICCGEMSRGDQLYPLHCPTVTCRFNFCVHCLRALCQAAADDYQEASDGSRQVKVHVRCPVCRARYNGGASSERGSGTMICAAVLSLRAAKTLEKAVSESSDSVLSASVLERKHNFLQRSSLEELQLAVRRLQDYQEEIGKAQYHVPPLDWTVWSRAFRMAHGSSIASTSSSAMSLSTSASTAASVGASSSASSIVPGIILNKNVRILPRGCHAIAQYSNTREGSQSPRKQKRQLKISTDPTLLQGLQVFMTPSEQEFVTDLFISGEPDKLAQAAHILHGIRELSTDREQHGPPTATGSGNLRHGSQCDASSSSSSSPLPALNDGDRSRHRISVSGNEDVAATAAAAAEIRSLKQRFPLPSHMPMCVSWPILHDQVGREDEEKEGPSKAMNGVGISLVAGNDGDDYLHGGCGAIPLPSDRRRQRQNGMSIARIRGLAGRLGLRTGDIVTHCQGDHVASVEAFRNALRTAWFDVGNNNNGGVNMVQIVVNADEATAKELRERALRMRRAGVVGTRGWA